MSKFVLASASPRRRELLENIGMEFDILVSSADESRIDRKLPPDMLVKELALLKAAESAKHIKEDRLVIGSDTVVVYEGRVLEKPRDREDARNMLKTLSGREHHVYTGVCVLRTSDFKAESRCEKTAVRFKELSDKTIESYLDTMEFADKAGGYGIQGKGALLVDGITGDYFNVVGLPLGLLGDMLRDEFEVEIL